MLNRNPCQVKLMVPCSCQVNKETKLAEQLNKQEKIHSSQRFWKFGKLQFHGFTCIYNLVKMYYLLLALDWTCCRSNLLLFVCTILCFMFWFPTVEVTTTFGKFSPFLVHELLECSCWPMGFLSETRLVV